MNPAILFIDQQLFDDASIRSNNFGDIVAAGIFQVLDIKNFINLLSDVSFDYESRRSGAHPIFLKQSGAVIAEIHFGLFCLSIVGYFFLLIQSV